MDANISLDLGKNVTDLLEKLANSLGMTVEKLFPYYVKQVYIEGLVGIIVVVFFLITSSLIAFKLLPKADFKNGNHYAVKVIICLIIFFFTTVGLAINIQDFTTAIMNPEYQAIHRIISDASKLVSK